MSEEDDDPISQLIVCLTTLYHLMSFFYQTVRKLLQMTVSHKTETDALHTSKRLTFHLVIGSIELRTHWEEKSLYIMNTMIPNTFNSVEQNAAITQDLSAFQTGGPHNTVVTQMGRPWAGIGSVLLNTHSVEHHDGAAVSLTARDGVPNYHNDNSFTSTPFGCGNDKNFFSLFCER